jgi:hypothetical protein
VVAYFPAPALCQGSDEDVIIEIGEIVFPDFVQRNQGGSGLRLKVAGDFVGEAQLEFGGDQFQILLGILRAWRTDAGQRADEIRPRIGKGSIRDEHGNQIVMVGSVIAHSRMGGEVELYARQVKAALEHSLHLRNALWLHGRRDCNAADYYMIYEYAVKEFAGSKALVASLNISNNDIDRFTQSANNLAPINGGRHVKETGRAPWKLEDQQTYISTLLRKWIASRSSVHP